MIEISEPTPIAAPRVAAVVLDWAGTTVDFGSRAPIVAILAACEEAGTPVTEQEARRPMGRAKRDHLRDLLADPAVCQRWRDRTGAAPGEADVDALYTNFLRLQAECVRTHSAVIPGCPAAIAACRELGVKIGSSTGYTRELLEAVADRAADEGYRPDLMLGADDVSPGRPAPWLITENARRLGVFPLSAVVKVDDTPTGVTAGRNAGVWSVGVLRSSNEIGLTEAALGELPTEEQAKRSAVASERLTAAGAHFLIDTIAELPALIERINQRLAAGERPQ